MRFTLAERAASSAVVASAVSEAGGVCFLCGPSKPSVAMDGDLRHHWNQRTVSSLFVLHLPLSGGTPH